MIKKLITHIMPPKAWRAFVFPLFAVMLGILFYIAYISNAVSYLSDDPQTCVNCHVMAPQYDTWFHSSHRERATCNDCHVPHNNIFNKYLFKAKDGMRHSFMFTFRMEPQVIRISKSAEPVVQKNCIRCHENLNHKTWDKFGKEENGEKKCWDCHREVPHGRVRSLSATPNTFAPLLKSPLSDWLNKK